MKGAVSETATVPLTGLAIAPNVAPQLVKQTLSVTGPVTAASTIKGTLSFTPDGAENGTPITFFGSTPYRQKDDSQSELMLSYSLTITIAPLFRHKLSSPPLIVFPTPHT